SSSGAAVAAAIGYGPLHQGSDGAGSIRIPSSLCGVFGHKPSFGLVAHPPAGGVARSPLRPIPPPPRRAPPPLQPPSGVPAPLPRVGGFSPPPRLSVPSPEPSFAAALAAPLPRLRIAFSPALGYAAVEPGVAESVAAAAMSFADLGHDVDQVELGLEDPWWI